MISVGGTFACAVNLIGEISCWGAFGGGQLGIGESNLTNLTTPSSALDVSGHRAARSVSAGYSSACAVLIDGAVVCWGTNSHGVLGTGDNDSTDQPTLPITLPSPGAALSVAVGEHHACALLTDQRVTCWGTSYDGELGDGTLDDSDAPIPPITLPSPGTASAIEVGRSATCALLTDGKVTCWGDDDSGQLGNGAAGNQTAPPAPVTLPSPGTATAIAMGDEHTCALLTDGKVTCWGQDYSGQLGNGAGTTEQESPIAPVTLPSPGAAVAIAAGGEATCVVLTDGAVTCWGDGSQYRLGNGATTDVDAPPAPVALPSGQAAAAIAVGDRTVCSLLMNGRLSCWGGDRDGTVGNGTDNGDQSSPSAATAVGGTGVQITANGETSCVLRANDNVYCWGSDLDDQMASGMPFATFDVPRTDPIPFPAPTSVSQMALAKWSSCARLTDNTVRCWGSDLYGGLGNGATGSTAAPGAAMVLPAPSTAIDVSMRYHHGCVVLTGGAVSCWGYNYDGQLGIGSTVDQTVPQPPVALPSPGAALKVATGNYHTCALLTDGKVTCWGWGANGRLGNNLSSSVTTPPAPITLPSPGTATAIAVGDDHTCALLTGGGVACWGANSRGQLGQGDVTQRAVPTLVTLPSPGTATAISAGEDMTCAVLTGGSVSCWGDGSNGEVGNGQRGAFSSPSAPLDLPAPGTAVAISAGNDHTCVVLSGPGKVSCWGADDSGELGDGAIHDDFQLTPSAGFLVNGRIVGLPDLLPVAPARLLETRSGVGNVTIDGLFQGVGKIAAGGTLELQVGGRGGISMDPVSVGLNFTVVNPSANGYLTVYRCSQARPLASNINFRAGKTIANLVVARPDPDGTLCIYSSALTDVLVDVSSVVMPGSSYIPLQPARLLETRTGVGNDTIDGLFEGGGQQAAGSTLQLTVGNRGGVPSGATAVIVNLAAVSPAANGFVTAYPCGVTRPTASNLNAQAGVTVSVAAVVELGTSDQICIYTSMATHLIVDANTAIPAQTLFAPVTPARLLDTRSGPLNVTIDGLFQGGGVGTAGSVIELTVAGRGNIGLTAKTVSLTIVAIAPATGGFITVYPCGTTRPTASNLNLVAGRTIANAVFAEVGDGGKVCIYRSAAVHLAVDAQGRLL